MTLRASALLFLAVLLLMTLTGCQTFPIMGGYDPQYTADKIKAIANDKNAGVVCSLVPTPWGVAKVLTINLDQRVIDSGGIQVSPDCTVTLTTVKPAPVAKEK